MASPHPRRRIAAVALGLGMTAAVTATSLSVSANATGTAEDTTAYYYDVHIRQGQDPAQLTRLGFNVTNDHAHDDVQIMGTEADARALQGFGYQVTRSGEVFSRGKEMRLDSEQSGTYYGGYRLPVEHQKHNQQVASQYPNLTKLHNIGTAYLGKHPIQVMCISNIQQGECELNQNSRKPKFSVIAQIHSRELTTGEMAWRFIDELTSKYGKDNEITELLNTREIWVLSMVNPDGVDKVASGGNNPLMQRKNMNYTDSGSNCGMSGGKHGGVDLNRNSSFHWDRNQGKGCDATFPGPRPDSEPETQAMQNNWLSKIYPDMKGGDNEKVKPGATGGFVTMHSYADLVLYPYGWTNAEAPDHAKLKEYSDAMARILGFKSEHGEGSLGYLAPGATDDWAYGVLGVPGFTWEIGGKGGASSCGGFFPDYSCQDRTFWPKVRNALIEGAKRAGNPYGTANNAPAPGTGNPQPQPQPQPSQPAPGWPQPQPQPQPSQPAPGWPQPQPQPSQPAPAPWPTQPGPGTNPGRPTGQPTRPRPTWPGMPGGK